MFNWIRARVKNAVLLGVADAIAALAGTDTTEDGEALVADRCRLLPAPPPMPDDDPFAGTPVVTSPSTRNGRKTVKTSQE